MIGTVGHERGSYAHISVRHCNKVAVIPRNGPRIIQHVILNPTDHFEHSQGFLVPCQHRQGSKYDGGRHNTKRWQHKSLIGPSYQAIRAEDPISALSHRSQKSRRANLTGNCHPHRRPPLCSRRRKYSNESHAIPRIPHADSRSSTRNTQARLPPAGESGHDEHRNSRASCIDRREEKRIATQYQAEHSADNQIRD